MRGRVAGGVACVALFVSSACSLFTDLGGYDGDGQTTIVMLDAASTETSAEPSIGDGASPNDDARSPADALADAPGEAGPCGATFCDDFEVPPFGATWTGKVETGGTVVSDSNALLASIGANASDAQRRALLYKRFDAPKSMSCAFAVHPIDLSAAAEVFSFTVNAPGYKSYSLWLALRAANTELGVAAEKEDGGTIYDTRGVKLVELGKWTNITMATDFTKLTLSEDDVVVKDESFFPPVTPVHVDAQVGITFHYATQPASVRIDDVRCTVTK